MATLKIGDKAPNFSLQDQAGNKISLSSLKGTNVVLYFYPKDMTPGCTQEACDFQSDLKKFQKEDVVVLGVSRDPIDRHEKFSEKYKLKFSLLSDEEGKTCQDYGVWQEKSLYGRKFMGIVRSTFLIDKKGKIQKIYPKVSVKGHVKEILEDLKSI